MRDTNQIEEVSIDQPSKIYYQDNVVDITVFFSKVVSFLGDPSFPKVAMQASRGGKIMLYQDLYSRYSRLQFSHIYDRPVAIAGMEHRLIRDLNIRGGFGVLDDERHGLLRRSLLWRRAEGQLSLEKIDFSNASSFGSTLSKPPSWSWMAYEGAIDYIHPPFDEVDWETEEVVSPWSSSPLETWSYSGDGSIAPIGLRVVARKFHAPSLSTLSEDVTIVLDDPRVEQLELYCVNLGRLKSSATEEALNARHHLVMFVSMCGLHNEVNGSRIYRRAGVGSVPGNLICWEGQGNRGEIR